MRDSVKALAPFVLLGIAACYACATLTPADRMEIAITAADIQRCEDRGRACKADGGADCWGVYDACMRDAGLR